VKNISMTLSSAEVALSAGRGSLTASVTNGSATAERVVLGAFAAGAPLPTTTPTAASAAPGASGAPTSPAVASGTGGVAGGAVAPGAGSAGDGARAANPTWTTIDRPLRTIGAGATEQYEVSFDTAGAEPGTYPVKLIPYSADEAPDDYADLGVVVRLVVPEPETVPPKPKRFPWWIAVVAGVVVLAGIGVWVFLATRGPALELASFSPSSGPATGGTEVHIFGHFEDPTVVSLGDTEITATRVTGEEYLFATPPVDKTGQTPIRVRSDGKSLGVVLFDYQAIPPTPPTTPVTADRPAVFPGDPIRITWQPYTCPVGPPLSGYEIRIDPRIATFLDQNPTSAETTAGTVVAQNFGNFTITYQAICGTTPSGFSPPVVITGLFIG
jgi:hypothetical protein